MNRRSVLYINRREYFSPDHETYTGSRKYLNIYDRELHIIGTEQFLNLLSLEILNRRLVLYINRREYFPTNRENYKYLNICDREIYINTLQARADT